MKKALVVLVAFAVFGLMTGVALAADPSGDGSSMTYTESGNVPNGAEYNANTPVTAAGELAGASRWSYGDRADVDASGNPVRKYEGSYNAFQDQTNQLYDYDATGRDSGPHGGYDTTSNKCKTCHAVHRATGTFALMRVDTPDQACEYCHVGDHRHSVVNAFWRDGTIYPKNGHTMGAGPTIPDSSVLQWEEVQSVPAGDGGTYQIRSRRYNPDKNKLMRWTMHGGKWIRVGPTFLRCQSCHQPHNAVNQVWKPTMSADPTKRWEKGYKLLRLSPSGGLASNKPDGTPYIGTLSDGVTQVEASTRRLDPGLGFIEFAAGTDPRLKVIEAATVDVRKSAGAGGVDTTGYTPFRYHADGRDADDPIFSQIPVYETSMSFYCADCHNLNIAGKDQVAPELAVGKYGNSMLGDRSHAVPYMIRVDGTGPGAQAQSGFHCYSCHNNDMPRIANTDTVHLVLEDGVPITKNIATDLGGSRDCGQCHISPKMYRAYKQSYRTFLGVAGGPSYSDFPHSGPQTGFKLLNAAPTQTSSTWDAPRDGTGDAIPDEESAAAVREPYVAGADGLDKICLICHGSQGRRSVGYDK